VKGLEHPNRQAPVRGVNGRAARHAKSDHDCCGQRIGHALCLFGRKQVSNEEAQGPGVCVSQYFVNRDAEIWHFERQFVFLITQGRWLRQFGRIVAAYDRQLRQSTLMGEFALSLGDAKGKTTTRNADVCIVNSSETSAAQLDGHRRGNHSGQRT
jgi:hypothetical protein